MDRILILGHTGMLGDCVSRLIPADVCPHRWPSREFKDFVQKYDYIINCIGAIPQRKDEFSVNTALPVWLDRFTNARIIHPSSDCENDDSDYGISKRIATDWLTKCGARTKIIKCSIIGFDKDAKSFLSWALSHSAGEPIIGHAKAIWSGITTLEWGKIAQKMIEDWTIYPISRIYHTSPVSKHSLLQIINYVFDRKNPIFYSAEGKDKTLIGKYTGSISDQLKELKKFYGS